MVVLGTCFTLFQMVVLTEDNPTLRYLLIPTMVIAAVIGWVAWTHTLQPAAPQVKRDTAGAEYLWVPAGGGPAGFWMMRTPVTNGLWRMAVHAAAVQKPRDT